LQTASYFEIVAPFCEIFGGSARMKEMHAVCARRKGFRSGTAERIPLTEILFQPHEQASKHHNNRRREQSLIPVVTPHVAEVVRQLR
jgi:hypothetical protein